MGLFIDAIKELASIDFLYYVPPDFDISPGTTSKLEQEFAEYWQADITLSLCNRSTHQHKILRRPNYLPGALNFFDQKSYIGVSGQNQVKALEVCLARKPDAILAHRLQAMCPLMLTKAKLPPIFFDLDDIEHISLARQIKQPGPYRKKDLGNYLYLPSLKRAELKAIRKAHKTFICSERDYSYLAKGLNLPGIVTIPNAIKLPSPQSLVSEPTLLFIGSYTYQPNITAAEFLIEQVWPHIHKSVTKAKLIIAGSCPERIRSYLVPASGVEFTGFVENLDELYQRSRVVCCPILSGSGTRVKLIEAAAYQKPIVSTSVGAEGLELPNEEAILLRDNPEHFAKACIELLRNDELCVRLGTAAYNIATKRYDRVQILRQIQYCLQKPQ
ncbi:MAG: glycosyltransferase family 4 protein [Pseudomonadota bacterium]